MGQTEIGADKNGARTNHEGNKKNSKLSLPMSEQGINYYVI